MFSLFNGAVAYLMGLWLNSTGLFYPFSVPVAVFHVMTFLGEKYMLFLKQSTSADCKVVPHQLKQSILPTTELSQSGFITPRRHKNIIYTIFDRKILGFVFPPPQSVVWPQAPLQECIPPALSST